MVSSNPGRHIAQLVTLATELIMASPHRRVTRSALLQLILEKQSASLYGLILIAFCGLLGMTQTIPNGLLATTVVVVVMYEFQKRLDQGVPLLQLTALIAVLQWLMGPLLAYNSTYEFGRYDMYVSEDIYFQYTLPATCFYVVVMLLAGASVKQRQLLQNLDRKNFVTIGIALNVISLGAAVIAPQFSGNLQFFMFLLSQLRYVGGLYLLFSRHELRLLMFGASLSPLLLTSLSSGMFHDMILWFAIVFCYWFAQRKWLFSVKMAVLISAAFALFSIQVVKQEYREKKRRGEDPSIITLMAEYVTPGGKAWESSALSLAVTRLNQGWIISAVMDNVPLEEPFCDGETLKDAFVSALVPRLLLPDKAEAGGRANFRRFTGLQIADSTSMGISPLGEAYANYGELGGTIVMVAYGAVFSGFFYLALLMVVRKPAFFFWLPMIFYQSIKAETEFVVVLNQITKGGLVAVVMYYLIDLNFPVRVRRLVLPLKSMTGKSKPAKAGAGLLQGALATADPVPVKRMRIQLPQGSTSGGDALSLR